ncbi:hypothetical protein LK533_03910 [Sphingomonas sp. PL-96]|uniref:hypothetical protein n=1 Tax=Sphingomonas sp. PL-96 TaxID=2887201 RepID=UPI001E56ED9A|nr:hypothetical protein [Sphingomonas sp. PL-96]MCC2975820.1 hypothetical protein [Sphingomonas sp. PL-96]
MDQPQANPGLSRIDAALARIEAAARARLAATDSLEHRHAALRTSMAEAIAALDQVIASDEGTAEGDA